MKPLPYAPHPMCARRFLFVILVLTLMVVAGAFAIFQWGGEMLIRQAIPEGKFQAAEAGGAPDYDKSWGAWIDRPELRVSPSLWQPENDSEPTVVPKDLAATFYIHPTTYLARDRWNAPIGHAESPRGPESQSRDRAELFVRSQASAFASFGPVWAPRYRQAAYGAFLLKSDDATKALDLAYSDVRTAFDVFLKEQPAGKPLILAAHSQGSLHLLRLLAERKASVKGRLVAAYVVGWPVSTASDLGATGLSACRFPAEVGCLLSWMSFAEPANSDLILEEWEKSRGPNGTKRRRQDVLCVNPISGAMNGTALPQANPGTLIASADLSSASLLKGAVGAACRDGLLILGGAVPAMGPYVLPGNNYHVYDYALFWGAVRRDAARRLAAWPR